MNETCLFISRRFITQRRLGLRELSLAVYHDDIIGVTVLSVIVTKSHLVFTQWDIGKEMIR